MELSRRDALAALGAIGVGTAAIGTRRQRNNQSMDDEETITQLLAAAEAIYPTAVDVDRSFIETVVMGRLDGRETYVAEQRITLTTLNTHARRIAGERFSQLDVEARRSVFRQFGVSRAHPNPDGTDEERIRYYVVNDLLFVLFSTPRGGELVGVENPPGYPGGVESYQRGPDS